MKEMCHCVYRINRMMSATAKTIPVVLFHFPDAGTYYKAREMIVSAMVQDLMATGELLPEAPEHAGDVPTDGFISTIAPNIEQFDVWGVFVRTVCVVHRYAAHDPCFERAVGGAVRGDLSLRLRHDRCGNCHGPHAAA